MARRVLNLDNFVDRPVVVIDNVEYRLYTTDLLPVVDNHLVRELMDRHDEIARKDKLTANDKKEVTRVLDQITRIVLDAPDDIHKRLKDRQRVEIVQSFQVPSLLLIDQLLATANRPSTETPTGASSPADSVGSTQR